MKTKFVLIILIHILMLGYLHAGGEWYREYEQGLEAMEAQDWSSAIRHFQAALSGNDKDNEHVRTYGMHFIEYFRIANWESAIITWGIKPGRNGNYKFQCSRNHLTGHRNF